MKNLISDLALEVDWSGIYGGILHYGLIIAFTGSALLAFLYFWSKGRLDIDEEPKYQMMLEDDQVKNHSSEISNKESFHVK